MCFYLLLIELKVPLYLKKYILSGLLNIVCNIIFNVLYTLFARFAHKQDSQLNSSVLITVWRFVMENSVTGLPTKWLSF